MHRQQNIETLHVSDSSSVHHQEFFTVNTEMVYVIQICWQLARMLSAYPYVLLCVQWKTPDDGQRNCPKHVEFYSKNKFEKSVHPVSFIIRIYHDAGSPERQIRLFYCSYFNTQMSLGFVTVIYTYIYIYIIKN